MGTTHHHSELRQNTNLPKYEVVLEKEFVKFPKKEKLQSVCLRNNTSLLGPMFRIFWKIKILLSYLLNIRVSFVSHLHLIPANVCRRSTSKIKIIDQSNHTFKQSKQFAKAEYRSIDNNVIYTTTTCCVLHLQVIAAIHTWVTSKRHGVNLRRLSTLHYKESFVRVKRKCN